MVSNEKSGAKEEIRFNVRISPDLHARVTQRAKANGRSMNSEVIAMLEQVIDDPGSIDAGALADEARRTLTALRQAEYDVERQSRKLEALGEELRAIYGDNPDGVDPLTYALRINQDFLERRRQRKAQVIIDRHQGGSVGDEG